MAKKAGPGNTGITITDADGGGAHDISNDITSWNTGTTMSTYDVTGVDKFKHERLAGVQDQAISLSLAVNPTLNHAHRLLSRGLTVARTFVLPLAPSPVSGDTQTSGVFIGSYGISRSNTGQLTAKATLKTQSGVVTYS